MPLTQSELGLTTTQYNTIKAGNNSPVFSVVAHRLNLDFSIQTVDPVLPSEEHDDWDAASLDAYDQVIYFNEGTFSVLQDDPTLTRTELTLVGYSNVAKQPDLFVSGSTIYLAWSNGTSVLLNTVTTDGVGGLTNGTQTVISPALDGDESISHVAMTRTNQVHFVVYDSSKRVYNLRVAKYNGSTWDIYDSNIWYMYPIQSFDAQQMDTDTDVITMAAQTPGTVAYRVVGATAEKFIEASGGIISFTFANDTWSDHTVIDTVDNIQTWRIRRGVKLSSMNGLLVATAYSVHGTEDHPIASYRYYVSTDGLHWSMGNILPLDSNPKRRGLKLCAAGDYILALDCANVFRSYSTMMLGYTAVDLIEDVSDYVETFEFSQDRIGTLKVVLDNSDSHFDNHNFINDVSVIRLYVSVGYYFDSTDNLIPLTFCDVDYLQEGAEPTEQLLILNARDSMAWMTDRSMAEESRYWEGQLIGADTYIDNTETRAGGLRHTAQARGTWQTIEGTLQLRSNNDEGVAFTTFSPYIWNGHYETEFQLSQLDNEEYAGIVFRALDNNNMMICKYDQTVDRIQLIQRLGGTDTILIEAGPMLWNADLQTRWLRAEFYYGYVLVQYSNDGITWSNSFSHVLNGQHEAGTYGPALLDIGYVGVIGQGYSEEADWTIPDFDIPDLSWTPPDLDFDDFDFEFEFGDLDELSEPAIIWTDDGEAAYTPAYLVSSPRWRIVDPPNGQVRSACLDRSSSFFTEYGGTEVGAWLFCVSGAQYWIYYVPDLNEETLTFTEQETDTVAYTIGDVQIKQNSGVHEEVVAAYRHIRGTWLAYTNDAGTTWSDHRPAIGADDTATSPVYLDFGPDGVCIYNQWDTANQIGVYFDVDVGTETSITGLSFDEHDRPAVVPGAADGSIYSAIAYNPATSVTSDPLTLAQPEVVGQTDTFDYYRRWIDDGAYEGAALETGHLKTDPIVGNGTGFQAFGTTPINARLKTTIQSRFVKPIVLNARSFETGARCWIFSSGGSINDVVGTINYTYTLVTKENGSYTRTIVYDITGTDWTTGTNYSSGLPDISSESGTIPPDTDIELQYVIMEMELVNVAAQSPGSYIDVMLRDHASNIEVVTGGTIYQIKPYNSSPAYTSRSPLFGVSLYGDIDDMVAHRINKDYIAAISKPYGSSSASKGILFTISGGSEWTLKYPRPDHIYNKLAFDAGGIVLGVGRGFFHRNVFTAADATGDLDTIFSANWNAIGVDAS